MAGNLLANESKKRFKRRDITSGKRSNKTTAGN
jgi:hypothetical protein